LFVILNSSSENGQGKSEPITRNNLERKEKILAETWTFLANLRTADGKFVSTGKKKTCVLGF